MNDPVSSQMQMIRSIAKGVAKDQNAWPYAEDLESVGYQKLIELERAGGGTAVQFFHKKLEWAMLDYLRKERRQSHVEISDEVANNRPDECPLPYQLIRERQQDRELRLAVVELPADEQRVLRRLYKDGATLQQVAKESGTYIQKIVRMKAKSFRTIRPQVEVAQAA